MLYQDLSHLGNTIVGHHHKQSSHQNPTTKTKLCYLKITELIKGALGEYKQISQSVYIQGHKRPWMPRPFPAASASCVNRYVGNSLCRRHG